jgi:hypothetical protein
MDRFRNRVVLFAVFALLPVVVFGVVLAWRSGDSAVVPSLLGLMWLVALGGALHRIRTIRCPRCSKSFSLEGWWWPSTRGRKCVHCGLELSA